MPNVFDKYENVEFGGALSPCFRHALKYVSDKRVLDIACGDGTYLKQFGNNSLGIDISDPNLIKCQSIGLKVSKADLNSIFPIKDNSFDTVYCSNILEHVDSPMFMLRESNRVLKKDGILVLCVPNEDSIIHWFYDYFEPNGRHLYSFSINNLIALMRETDFDIIEMFGDYHSVLSRKLKLTSALELLHLLPVKLTNRMAVFNWVIAKKK